MKKIMKKIIAICLVMATTFTVNAQNGSKITKDNAKQQTI